MSSGVQASYTSKTHRDVAHLEQSATRSLAIERKGGVHTEVALLHHFSSDSH